MSWSAWEPAPLVLASFAVGLLLYGRAFARLRRRGRADLADGWRAAAFAAALGVAAWALLSPLDEVADESLLSAHMLQHVLIGDVVPALLVVSVRGPLAFLVVPAPALRRLARIDALRTAAGFLLRPRVSFGAWLAPLLAWHVPAVYDYAVAHETAHDVEHASFLVGGLLVWAQLVDPVRRGELSRTQRLAFATALFAVGAALAAVLATIAPAYPHYAEVAARPLGLSARGDQQLAALVMVAEQALALGVCAFFLAAPKPRAGVSPALHWPSERAVSSAGRAGDS